MKHPDYDWMLFGCHPISDIAMAYCPCEHATSSTRAFRRLLRLYPNFTPNFARTATRNISPS